MNNSGRRKDEFCKQTEGYVLYDNIMDETKSNKHSMSEEDLLNECKYHSLVLGVVIGCFIQLSCMGAFFIYSKLTHGQDYSIWTFSLAWSAFTSSIGLGIMIILSLLFRRTSSNEHMLLQLELFVSSGAVIGVSVTWLVKNICMGVPDLAWQSFLSIVLALCYITIARKLVAYSPMEENNDLDFFLEESSKPLLEELTDSATKNITHSNSTTMSMTTKTRCLGYVLGAFIGCLLQISSLAAHQMFFQHGETFVSIDLGPTTTVTATGTLIVMCLVWDLMTCSLGVAALLLVRKLLLLQMTSPTEEDRNQLVVFETCFCIGALFGVNICWMITDMLLGLHALLCKTIVTLIVSLLIYWRSCKTNEDADGYDTENDDDDNSFDDEEIKDV